MTYLTKLSGTMSRNRKQFPAGLTPRIIPHYLLKHLWEKLAMGENPTQQSKTY